MKKFLVVYAIVVATIIVATRPLYNRMKEASKITPDEAAELLRQVESLPPAKKAEFVAATNASPEKAAFIVSLANLAKLAQPK